VIVLILNQYYIEGAKTEIIKIWKNLVKFDIHSFSNINCIVKQFELEYSEARRTPMAAGAQIGARVDLEDVIDKPYKSLVGSLL
jgi:hypothetical protein